MSLEDKVIVDLSGKPEEVIKDDKPKITLGMPTYNCKIRYVSPDVPRLKAIAKGDWIDVYAWFPDGSTLMANKGEIHIIPLGFALQLPEGFEAHLASRSSTAKKFGIIAANGFGVIDNSYRGNNDIWGFVAYTIRDNVIIRNGDRIAQFRIVEVQPKIEFEEVDDLGNKDRGGYGSTGSGVL